MTETHLSELAFASLDLVPTVAQGIRDAGFVRATPVQAMTLPIALTGKDVAGQAQTGTGKTAAFGIPMIERIAGGTQGTLQLPGSTGGPNWQGGSIDPETNVVYIYSKDEPALVSMVKDEKRSNMDYINGGGSEGGQRLAIDNLPIIRPPWCGSMWRGRLRKHKNINM